MTNKDKFLRDGVEAKEIWHKYQEFLMNNDKTENTCTFVEFMEEQSKPTLTEDEKAILRNIPQRYHTIGRYCNGKLCLKCNDMDDYGTETDFEIDILYSLLFQFIQPRRRI